MVKISKIYSIFEKQADLHPNKIAVIDAVQQLTYRQLDEQANQFAHYLKERGFVSGEGIALKVEEKSVQVLVCILGTLKAGGYYVPINPDLPKETQKAMLDSVKPKFIISTRSPEKEKTISITTLDSILAPYCKKRPIFNEGENYKNRVYVNYTSGTTGQPKGVPISHRNLISTYYSWQTVYQLSSNDRHLNMAVVPFDVFTGDWVRALCSGACLILCGKDVLLNSSALYQLLRKEQITVAEFVPAVLRKLLEFCEKQGEHLTMLRLLICGSDLWNIKEYKKAKLLSHPDTRVISSYGLTEATIDSTYFELTENSRNNFNDLDIVPIGIPFPHASAVVMNAKGIPVKKVHEIGEIYIGGKGVSEEGYLNQPSLTKERFSHSEYLDGELFYRTGDLAFYLEGGVLSFLGRNELQTNINGKRVDITSIESALEEHPTVKGAIVLSKLNNNMVQLQAFLVSKNENIKRETVVSFLKDHLPAYSIPSKYYLIDKINLTLHGKVDRKQSNMKIIKELLPEVVSPANVIEEQILSLWKHRFGQENIGVTTSFIDLNRDSIEYSDLLIVVGERFGVKLYPCMNLVSVREMSKEVRQQIKEKKANLSQNNLFTLGDASSYLRTSCHLRKIQTMKYSSGLHSELPINFHLIPFFSSRSVKSTLAPRFFGSNVNFFYQSARRSSGLMLKSVSLAAASIGTMCSMKQ